MRLLALTLTLTALGFYAPLPLGNYALAAAVLTGHIALVCLVAPRRHEKA